MLGKGNCFIKTNEQTNKPTKKKRTNETNELKLTNISQSHNEAITCAVPSISVKSK